MGVLPPLLSGIVPRDGGTGEILVGKLPVVEDSLGGKFRRSGRASAWGLDPVRFCPRFGNMAISCPGILLDGALAFAELLVEKLAVGEASRREGIARLLERFAVVL